MQILLFTPADKGSTKGNRITALRWKRLLGELGHRVVITNRPHARKCDLAIAIHARKAARFVQSMKNEYPSTPVVLCLSGTDLYRDIHQYRSVTKSIELADRLIVLQKHALTYLHEDWFAKAVVVPQSCVAPKGGVKPLASIFEVVVVGHLRAVKDPFRAAMAVRQLSKDSEIRVSHLGAALSEAMLKRAERESQRNNRYHYEGSLSREATLRRIARARLLVLSSKLEGGANVLSEAICCGTPVLATRISGSVGILGDDYPGLFDVGATDALTDLLRRCEKDSDFYEDLCRRVKRFARDYTPNKEKQAWQKLLANL